MFSWFSKCFRPKVFLQMLDVYRKVVSVINDVLLRIDELFFCQHKPLHHVSLFVKLKLDFYSSRLGRSLQNSFYDLAVNISENQIENLVE